MRFIAITALLMLGACDQVGFDKGNDKPAPAPAEADSTQDAQSSDLDAEIVIAATPDVMATMSVPATITVADNGDNTITLSGSATERDRPSGRTDGAAFVVGPEYESRIGGNRVKVSVLAKGAPGAEMNVAYSTDEVGNSGWRTFPLTSDFETYTFKMKVDEPLAPGNDYIGIVPVNGDVTVSAVGVDIIGPWVKEAADEDTVAEDSETVETTE